MLHETEINDFIAHLSVSSERIRTVADAMPKDDEVNLARLQDQQTALHTCQNICTRMAVHLPYHKVAVRMVQQSQVGEVSDLKAIASNAHQSLCQCLREDAAAVSEDLCRQLEAAFAALQDASVGEDWQSTLLLHAAICDVFRAEIEQRCEKQDQFADWWNVSPFPSLLLTTSRALLLLSGSLRDQTNDIVYAIEHLLARLSLFGLGPTASRVMSSGRGI